jgi:hypothetical protein
MRISAGFRAAVIALTALGGIGLSSAAFVSPALADSGSIRFNVVKAGFVFGGSAGSGTLNFHGRNYPISMSPEFMRPPAPAPRPARAPRPLC